MPGQHAVVVPGVEGDRTPLSILVGDVDSILLELLRDFLLIITVWALEMLSATGHGKPLDTVPVEMSPTARSSDLLEILQDLVHLLIADDTIRVWRGGEGLHLLLDPVHEAVGVHLAHELEGGPCLLATWEMHVDTTVLLVTPAAISE